MNPPNFSKELLIRVPIGDVIDRITILEVKKEFMHNESQAINVAKELATLRTDLKASGIKVDEALSRSLRQVNRDIFILMDKIFENPEVDIHYARLTKETVDLNVTRAEIKREINLMSGSVLVEEKTYFEKP